MVITWSSQVITCYDPSISQYLPLIFEVMIDSDAAYTSGSSGDNYSIDSRGYLSANDPTVDNNIDDYTGDNISTNNTNDDVSRY